MSEEKTTIEITLSDTVGNREVKDFKWKIEAKGMDWSESEIIEGTFDDEGQTVIETEGIYDDRRKMVYNLISYVLGDI